MNPDTKITERFSVSYALSQGWISEEYASHLSLTHEKGRENLSEIKSIATPGVSALEDFSEHTNSNLHSIPSNRSSIHSDVSFSPDEEVPDTVVLLDSETGIYHRFLILFMIILFQIPDFLCTTNGFY